MMPTQFDPRRLSVYPTNSPNKYQIVDENGDLVVDITVYNNAIIDDYRLDPATILVGSYRLYDYLSKTSALQSPESLVHMIERTLPNVELSLDNETREKWLDYIRLHKTPKLANGTNIYSVNKAHKIQVDGDEIDAVSTITLIYDQGYQIKVFIVCGDNSKLAATFLTDILTMDDYEFLDDVRLSKNLLVALKVTVEKLPVFNFNINTSARRALEEIGVSGSWNIIFTAESTVNQKTSTLVIKTVKGHYGLNVSLNVNNTVLDLGGYIDKLTDEMVFIDHWSKERYIARLT